MSNRETLSTYSTFTQPVNFHPFLFGRFPVEKYVPISSERSYPFCERFAPQNGFPYFMEEVGASTQPRLQFSRGTLSDIPGASVSPREKYCNSTISGEHIFSGVVSTRSSIFTADRFSDNSDGCYSSGPSTVQRKEWMKIDWLCKCATTAWNILVNTRGDVDRPKASS
jgi:hypothetical protein